MNFWFETALCNKYQSSTYSNNYVSLFWAHLASSKLCYLICNPENVFQGLRGSYYVTWPWPGFGLNFFIVKHSFQAFNSPSLQIISRNGYLEKNRWIRDHKLASRSPTYVRQMYDTRFTIKICDLCPTQVRLCRVK